MILVTGGTGLVGSHLLYQLTQKESTVRAIYRNEASQQKVLQIFSYYTENPQENFDKIEWVQADITDVPSMIPAFKNITQVYHVAALISFNPKDYIEMRKVNIHGSAVVVNLSIDAGVKKMCYVSSIAAIGKNPSKPVIDEENEWNDNEKNYGYAITKYGGEMEVWRASQEGIDVVIVNPGIIIGPGFWDSGSGKLFKQVAKGFPFYSEGITGFVGIDDVVRPMLQLMESNVKNQRFILVAENKSFKDAFISIAKSLNVRPPKRKISVFATEIFWRFEWIKSFFTGKSPRITKHSAKALHSAFYYSNNKIKRTLGYEFEPIEEAIQKTGKRY